MTDRILESPDCRNGDHHKCDNTGWNITRDMFDTCPCPHHQEETP